MASDNGRRILHQTDAVPDDGPPLCNPQRAFAEAVNAFQTARKTTLDGLR